MNVIYSINKNESNRITFIRAISMILVIYLHQFVETNSINEVVDGLQYIISRIITFAAVPSFYLISSVLLYSKEFTWKSNLKKKAKTLVMPYFIWISLYILLYYVGQTLPITAPFFANAGRKVVDMSLVDFVGAYVGFWGQGRFVNALWFLFDLMILNLVAPMIKQCIDRFPRLYFIIIGVIWFVGGTSVSFILNSQSICFWSLGYYIVKYNVRMKYVDDIPQLELIVAYVPMLFLEYFFFVTESELRIPIHAFTTIIGIILIVKISGIYHFTDRRMSPVIYSVAKYSFFIYASHDFVQTVLKRLFVRGLNQTVFVQSFEYVIIPLITCIVCLVFAIVLERTMPYFYNLLSGARLSQKRGTE